MFRLLILHTNDDIWHRFYDTTINLRVYKSPQYISSNGNYYIKNVLFEKFNSEGAIRIKKHFDFPFDRYEDHWFEELEKYEEMLRKSPDKTLIFNSFFLNCYSDGDGGAIYIEIGSCIQYRICSINSKCTSNGCHSYVETSFENYVIDSSITDCKGTRNSICLKGGYQFIGSTNITHAKCDGFSGYDCSGDPLTHQINFTSVVECTCNYECIIIHANGDQYVTHSNFINNTHRRIQYFYDGNYGGIVLSYGCNILEYSLCTFISNSAPSLFYHDQRKDRCNFIVSGCYLHDNSVDVNTTGRADIWENGVHKFGEYQKIILNTTDLLVIDVINLPIQKCILLEVHQSSSYNPYQDPDKLKIKPI